MFKVRQPIVRSGRGVALATMSAAVLTASLLASTTTAGTAASATNASAQLAGDDQCLDADGNPTGCQYDISPVELPAGVTLGEYELASLSRGAGGEATVAPEEFKTGSDTGSCFPEADACTSLTDTFSLVKPNAPKQKVFSSVGPPEGLEMDAAVTQSDFNGDGLSDVVTASRCRQTDFEICLKVFNPAAAAVRNIDGWSKQYPTGLFTDVSGFGRIRLASGVINERLASVVGAHYSIAPDQAGMLATFTTSEASDFTAGQLVRFKPGSDLESHLCVTSSDGDEQCVSDLGDHYLPIQSVNRAAHTFTVRLGRLVDADPGDPAPVVPDDWSASDCGGDSCATDAVAVSPGVAMAFAAPHGSLRLAAFAVNFDHETHFSDIDVATVGKLIGDAATGRAPFDVVAADFDGLGVSDIAVTWGAPSSSRDCYIAINTSANCSMVAFYDTNNGRQLIEENRQRLNSSVTVSFVSAAAGMIDNDAGSNTNGADLVVARVDDLTSTGYHRLDVYDIDQDLRIHAAGHSDVWNGTVGAAVRRSYVRVATGDFDLDGTDEIVLADTRLTQTPTVLTVAAPITVTVFRRNGDTNQLDQLMAPWVSPAGIGAFGTFGRGQIDLAVGALGRAPDQASESFPNSINPDILLSWTCSGAGTCGTGNAADAGAAVLPMAVHIASDGSATFKMSNLQKPIITPGRLAQPIDSPLTSEPTRTGLALADFNADSETLGYPVTYVKVNEVKPLLVLRGPPVQIDAFDDNKPDGINYYEVQDIDGCFANASCDSDTHTSYTTSSTVDASVSGTVTNDWGIDSSIKGGFGDANVPIEAYIKATINYAGQNQETNTQGKSFAYSSTHTVFAGRGDEAYAATQSSRISEFPVYAGVSAGATSTEPIRSIVTINPSHTEFGWIELGDPDYGFGFSSPVSGNLLSYPSGVDRLAVGNTDIDSVSRLNSQQIEVKSKSGMDFTCDVDNWQNLSTQYLNQYPCSGGGVPVTLTDAGNTFSGEYTVTKITDSKTVTLTRSTGTVGSAGDLTCSPACRLERDPGMLATGFETVSSAGTASGTLQVTDQSSFEGSASWNVTTGLEGYIRSGGDVDEAGIKLPAILEEEHLSATYARTESSTMSVAATVGTTFDWSIGKLPTAHVSYRVRPWLIEDPVTHAMTLDWTATCGACSATYWKKYYSAAPDPALALPSLMDPYKSPNGIPNIQGVDLLRTPGMMSWTCDKDGVCRPPAALPVGKTVTLSANVHNYSLKAFQSPSPMKVKFFAGDPGRGGYEIAEATVPDVIRDSQAIKTECGPARFCIPAQGDVVATVKWTPPAALGGVGSPTNPFPVYAVIDPANHVDEVHDWTAPVQLKSCYQTYPYLPPSPADQYDPPESNCPVTNNEGYFLPEFSGKAGPRNDLFVNPSDIAVAKDGKSVKVTVHATNDSDRSLVRLWFCRPVAGCSPSTTDHWQAQANALSINGGSFRRVTIPTNIGSGSWRVVAQVVPISDYEAPGDAGYLPKMNLGKLANNVAVKTVSR